MPRFIAFAFALAAFASPSSAVAQGQPNEIPDYIAAAIGDPSRDAETAKEDAGRKPADVLVFLGVKPGDRIADLGPGQGYYTHLLSRVVGEGGRVYAANLDWIAARFPKSEDGVKALDARYANVTGMTVPMAAPEFPEPLDAAIISLLYHDGHWQKVDMASMNTHLLASLKPGGVFVIIDHVAEAGSGARDVGTLHRIDPALVRQEVEAAGFVFDGESDVLRNPDDPHTESVFGSLRGSTDKFLYRFRKPPE